jgi:hypothetical protein
VAFHGGRTFTAFAAEWNIVHHTGRQHSW